MGIFLYFCKNFPKMKVLLINTSERTGGAAIACNRLMEALKKSGVRAKMLVRDKQTDRLSVVAVRPSLLLPLKFLWERLVVLLAMQLNRRNLFQVDIANTGVDITKMREYEQADIIHLHWVNQGFLSLDTLERMLTSDKPVVITMHDMWYFTGICHYASDCRRYLTGCSNCTLLGRGQSANDVSRRVFERKRKIYAGCHLTFVGCSRWMADLAKEGVLTAGHSVTDIPNAIDTTLFCPHSDKVELRRRRGWPTDKRMILFGAQRITDERKGFEYLREACRLIVQSDTEVAKEAEVVVVGGDSDKVAGLLPLPVRTVDYVKEPGQMVELYNMVDAYVTPSLQDNLPNTIVEAMACGIPCVGFRVGGIPEMIDHHVNGYVAEYRSARDLARGIVWTLTADGRNLSEAARRKALETYSEETVAKQYINVYKSLMTDNPHA